MKPLLSCKYRVEASYDGYDCDKDEKLESAVGRDANGAGYGFGQRDLDWFFKQLPAARRAAAKLKRFKGVKVQLEHYDKNDELIKIEKLVKKRKKKVAKKKPARKKK